MTLYQNGMAAKMSYHKNIQLPKYLAIDIENLLRMKIVGSKQNKYREWERHNNRAQ